MSNALKFVGKDPQGNQKGVSVDLNGRIDIRSRIIKRHSFRGHEVLANDNNNLGAATETDPQTSSFSIAIKSDVNHDFTVEFMNFIPDFSIASNRFVKTFLKSYGGREIIVSGIPAVTEQFFVEVINNSDSARTYDCDIVEVR